MNRGALSLKLAIPVTEMSVLAVPHVQPVPVGGHVPLFALATVTVKVAPDAHTPVLGVLVVQLATIFAGPFGSPMLVVNVIEVGSNAPVTNAGTGTPLTVGPGLTAERTKRWRLVETGSSWLTLM